MKKRATITLIALVAAAWSVVKTFVPSYVISSRESRERVLQQDLFTMRQILDQYTPGNHRQNWLPGLQSQGLQGQVRQSIHWNPAKAAPRRGRFSTCSFASCRCATLDVGQSCYG